ncbi:MAG TPA: DUF4139 domain-containing protein [Burkholderiales bacterium]
MPLHRNILALALAAALPAAGAAEERRSTLADQQSVAVTIYNEDLALIKDTRRVTLDAGRNVLALREVSAQMRPETAQLRSLSHPGSFTLLEQNFDFDLLTPAKLLEKYVGRTVRIVRTHPTTGAETIETAQVLSANEGVVLRIGDRIETGLPGRIVYDDVPATLRDRPTLVTHLESRRTGEQTVELSYLTGGLAWQADYVAELNDTDTALALSGWVTLTNRSGTAYPNARLRLVAGDVHRVREELRYAVTRAAPAPETAREDAVRQEALFEYHLYTLARPTTLADNQTKQVALLDAASVPVTKELVLQGQEHYYRAAARDLGEKHKVAVYVRFENREKSGLGMPLPKGIVRVYKKDRAGNAQFVGEDRIDHTPKNEQVRLRLGDSFDVTARRKQTDFRKTGERAFESAYEIALNNAKREAVTVIVREPVPGDWRMLEQSHPHAKAAAGIAEWRVTVPAEGTTTLRYRVLVQL